VLALSPDGTRLVVAMRQVNKNGNSQLYIRKLDQLNFIPIPGAEPATNPFFSPDSQWIGFYSAGKLKKVSVSGGSPLVVCNSGDISGATWSTSDEIVFSTATRLYKVRAAGGEATVIATPDLRKGEADYNWPEFLPGGKAIVFAIQRMGGTADDAKIVVQS